MLAAYTALSYLQHVRNPEDTTMPTWSQMADGMMKVTTPDRGGNRWIVVDAWATAYRLVAGLAVGIFFAVVLGVLMGCFATIEAIFIPPLSLLAKIPPTAALAVFFVMVGTNTEMYVTMIAFGVLPVLAQAVYLAVKEVPEELIHKGYTLGASHAEIIWNVILRFIFPKILDNVRLQIGPAMVYLIAAEMMVGHEGFGYRVRLQSKLLNMNVVYPYLAVLATVGYAVDHGLRFLQTRVCPWYGEEGR